jgi:hypothetical protein
VPLLALDFLARIVPVRINARPPYMGRLKSSGNSLQRRFNFCPKSGGLIFALTARGPAQSIDPFFGSTRAREHSSAPTA